MPQEPLGNRRPPQFTLRSLLVAIAVIALLLGLAVSGIRHARALAQRTQCANNLKQLGLAMHNYYDAFGSFPAAYAVDKDGHPINSWRLPLSGYLEAGPPRPRSFYEEPWDSPVGLRHTMTSIPCYHCPSDSSAAKNETNYVLIVGPGMFAEGPTPTQLDDIKDGASNTIMLVETVGAKIPWAAPRDLEADKITFEINPAKTLGISSNHSGGANCAFVDRSVRFLSNSTPPQQVRAMCTRADGEAVTLP